MRPPESRLRNRLVVAAGFATLVAAGSPNRWLALAGAAVTAALIVWASSYRGRRLFVTADPSLYPVGSRWRQYRVIALEPIDPEGFWLVRGERAW